MIRQNSAIQTSIVDMGGGASRLVDALLDLGYADLTVLGLAAPALVALSPKGNDDTVTAIVKNSAGSVVQEAYGPDGQRPKLAHVREGCGKNACALLAKLVCISAPPANGEDARAALCFDHVTLGSRAIYSNNEAADGPRDTDTPHKWGYFWGYFNF